VVLPENPGMVFNELARADGHSDDDEIIPALANGFIR
jgi:hypothetical protein